PPCGSASNVTSHTQTSQESANSPPEPDANARTYPLRDHQTRPVPPPTGRAERHPRHPSPAHAPAPPSLDKCPEKPYRPLLDGGPQRDERTMTTSRQRPAEEEEETLLREVVETLAPMERRAGSPAERDAAYWIAGRLERAGCAARVEEEEF